MFWNGQGPAGLVLGHVFCIVLFMSNNYLQLDCMQIIHYDERPTVHYTPYFHGRSMLPASTRTDLSSHMRADRTLEVNGQGLKAAINQSDTPQNNYLTCSTGSTQPSKRKNAVKKWKAPWKRRKRINKEWVH
jgi:hypothetical protein